MTNRALLILGIATMLAVSCKEKDLYEEVLPSEAQVNTFDFSTVQNIDLSVDYSAYKTYGPVYFSVYSENPFEGSGEAITLKKNVKPIYENYTNADGKFNETVQLPSYAQDLYVITGNFFVMQSLIDAKISNGKAIATAENFAESEAEARKMFRKTGVPTNSLETLYQLSYKVDVNTADKLDEKIFPTWYTPLGKWDSESGRPEYLLDKNTANPDLLFTEEELDGLYQTISNALVANQTCNETYRKQADLTLERESEVAITFLGGITCWNNSLGYYYYTDDNKPTSPEDLHIIMLFPNTQEGKWFRDWMKHPNFYGNIALERGDVVKLMYYPNIANGDLSGATDKFPKGTKLGFILKPNGWGMQKCQGDKKFYNSYKGEGTLKQSTCNIARQYNVWAASTNGLSYCSTEQIANDKGAIATPNPNGESRTAKFAYKNENGDEYAIISFEDACNDLDFDDVVFALKPVSAFTKLPVVENKKTTTNSVYAFEDLWPDKGDFDMNDALVELNQEKEFSKEVSDKEYKIYKQTFSLTTYQNFVTLKSGLAVTLETKTTPTSVVMKKIAPNSTDTIEANFTKDGNVYLLTEDIKAELNTTYILELNYKNGITNDSKTATIKPFIYRTEGNKRWEVHLPYEAPSSKMETNYFGTMDDCSVPEEGKYFVRKGDYPFAFCLTGVSIDSFQETLLLRENEKKKINELYPEFLEWSTSKGAKYPDWYLHPVVKEKKQ